MSELITVDIEAISPAPDANLREAKTDTEEFAQLVQSIASKGFLGAITVRPALEEGQYFITDGLQRLTAAKAAGLTEVPVQVRAMSELEVLESQIMMNEHGVPTSHSEYAAQVWRICELKEGTCTEQEIATSLKISVDKLRQWLSFYKLPEATQDLLDAGTISLGAARQLAKLNKYGEDEVASFHDAAATSPLHELTDAVNAHITALKQAAKEGKEGSEAAPEFKPSSSLRNKGEVEAALEEGMLDRDTLLWVLKLDDASVAEKRAKFEAQIEAREAKKAKSSVEKKQKQLDALEEKKAKLMAEIADAD